MQTKAATLETEASNNGLTQSQKHIILEIVEYVPNSTVRKTIIKKKGGSITAMSVDEGEMFCEKTSKCDTYVQVIDGKAEVIIDNQNFNLQVGDGIIIPQQTVYCFIANEEFKLITTIIKDTGAE